MPSCRTLALPLFLLLLLLLLLLMHLLLLLFSWFPAFFAQANVGAAGGTMQLRMAKYSHTRRRKNPIIALVLQCNYIYSIYRIAGNICMKAS